MIPVKSEFKKGKIELLEIPIVIRKARRDDYVSSTIIAEK